MTDGTSFMFPARAPGRYQFRIDGKLNVPDPASAFQPQDVHDQRGHRSKLQLGRSGLARPPWQGNDPARNPRRHLHARRNLPRAHRPNDDIVAEITAIELMPVASFFGRNWGYDRVLLLRQFNCRRPGLER
ncbi:MAG: hypothetical protein R3D62_02850 [Xanthobacteraceae bacterium]